MLISSSLQTLKLLFRITMRELEMLSALGASFAKNLCRVPLNNVLYVLHMRKSSNQSKALQVNDCELSCI